MKTKPLLKWLIPLLFVLLGVFLYTAVHGHGFLGLISFGIAGVISAYFLIALLKDKYFSAAKVLNLILTGILCVGILIFGITEAVILHASQGDPDETCQYIVVLGAKVNGTAPSLSLQDRIRAAADYLTAHPEVIAILSGGQGDDEGISEAECMYRELVKKGIEADRILRETQATSTMDNLELSLALLEQATGRRPEKLGILSSEYHLLRARMCAEQQGVQAVLLPAKTRHKPTFLLYFFREILAVWYYSTINQGRKHYD